VGKTMSISSPFNRYLQSILKSPDRARSKS
jgi:hypothetical protein